MNSLYKIRTLFLLFSSVLIGLAILIFLPQKVNASAPADLTVGMALLPYGASGTTPLNYGAKVNVVPKRTSNGINIPISGAPYNGNHLAPGGGSSPSTNSMAFGIDGPTRNNIFGGTFIEKTFNNLIWCGNSVGVPDREFQLDVSVGYATGNSQTINVNGRNYTGKWSGYWHFEGTGANNVDSWFQGYSVRVPALNPYRTFVFFVFQEDPPPAPKTYDGTIATNKRLADGTLVPWTGQPPNPPFSSYVKFINPNGGEFGGSNLNPYSFAPVWVKWNNHESNEEGRWVSERVDVPSGYRINRVQTSLGGQALANDGLTCTGPNNTDSCTVKGLTVRNGTVTYVDWFYEKIPPTFDVSCVPDNANGAGGKITVVARSNIPGDNSQPSIAEKVDNDPVVTKLITSPYEFAIDNYRDDRQHTYTATYAGLSKSATFGPNSPCKINAWYYPWLQTTKGDVISSGKAIGQLSSANYLGSKSASEFESDYLLITGFVQSTNSGGPFCSRYNYIISNTAATTTDGRCKNGTGYSLNSYSLGAGPGNDNVYSGVQKAYDQLPAECKDKPSPVSVDLATCSSGIIIKREGNGAAVNLGNFNVTKGRVTVLVNGDLNINNDITYSAVGGTEPKDQPNLAIVVNGKVNIGPQVTSIKALIYATDVINTCSSDSASCKNNQLKVEGALVGKSGFSFKRSFNQVPSNPNVPKNGPAAEIINLNPVSVLYPPPGISNEFFGGYNNSALIDTTEYNPRF